MALRNSTPGEFVGQGKRNTLSSEGFTSVT